MKACDNMSITVNYSLKHKIPHIQQRILVQNNSLFVVYVQGLHGCSVPSGFFHNTPWRFTEVLWPSWFAHWRLRINDLVPYRAFGVRIPARVCCKKSLWAHCTHVSLEHIPRKDYYFVCKQIQCESRLESPTIPKNIHTQRAEDAQFRDKSLFSDLPVLGIVYLDEAHDFHFCVGVVR